MSFRLRLETAIQAKENFYHQQTLAEGHLEKAAREAYSINIKAIHGKIGDFIDQLAQMPEYATGDGTMVQIHPGTPTEWEDLPDIAANFLGKGHKRTANERLVIFARNSGRIREMRFLIESPDGDIGRLIKISTFTRWFHKNEAKMEFDSRKSLKRSPREIIDAYNDAENLNDGDKANVLMIIEGLVEFAGREAIKAIQG